MYQRPFSSLETATGMIIPYSTAFSNCAPVAIVNFLFNILSHALLISFCGYYSSIPNTHFSGIFSSITTPLV